jgi:hypothetical protein
MAWVNQSSIKGAAMKTPLANFILTGATTLWISLDDRIEAKESWPTKLASCFHAVNFLTVR